MIPGIPRPKKSTNKNISYNEEDGAAKTKKIWAKAIA
jgi:hypothetical protein